MNYIYGLNAVAEAIKARGRAFQWVGLAKERHDLRLQRIIEECRKLGVPVRFLQRTELDRLAGNGAHQGVVAVTSAKQYSGLDDVVDAKRGVHSLIVVLDGVEDPHNLGAILRTADAAGAEGKGVHDLVRKKCDFLVSIPMLGKVSSLNVSVAAGVVLYEIVRQRRKRATPDSE